MRNGELNLEPGAGDELRCDQPCPHCAVNVRVPLWRIGRRGQCPACAQEFRAACTPDFLDELPEQLRRVLVLCEHCNAEYVSPIELLGVRTRCLSCQRRFRRRLLRDHIDFRGNGHARVACPQCQENFVIRRSKLGKNSRCEKCGQTFLLAERESSTGSGFLDQAVARPAKDAIEPNGRARPQPRPRKPKKRPEREAEPAFELPLPPQEADTTNDDLLSLLEEVADPEVSLDAIATDLSDDPGTCDGTEVLVAVVETDDEDAPLPLDVDERATTSPAAEALTVGPDAHDEAPIVAPDVDAIRLDDDEPAQTTAPEAVEVEAAVDVDVAVAIVLDDEPGEAEPATQAAFERDEPEAADIDDPLPTAVEETPIEASLEHALEEPGACHPEEPGEAVDAVCHASDPVAGCADSETPAVPEPPQALEPLAEPRPCHPEEPRPRLGLLNRLKRAMAREQVAAQLAHVIHPPPQEQVTEAQGTVAIEAAAPVASPPSEPAEPDPDAPTPPLEELITITGDFQPLTLEPVCDAVEFSYLLPPQFDVFDHDVAPPDAAEAEPPEPADADSADIDCEFSNILLVDGGDISDVESVNEPSPPDSVLNMDEAAQPPVAPSASDAAEPLSFDQALAELEDLAAATASELEQADAPPPMPPPAEPSPSPEVFPQPAIAQPTMKSVSLELLATCRGHTRPVFSVDVSSDGATAISGGLDGVLRLWDTVSGSCTRELPAQAGMIWRVTLFDEACKAASAHEDGIARIWDLAEGACIAKVPGPADHVQSTCFSPDGGRMLVGDAAGMLSLINLNTAAPRRFKGHQGRMTAAKFAGVDRAITAGEDNLVRIWDVTSLRCTALLEGHTRPARAVAMDDAGAIAVSGGDDCTVRVWDLATNACRLIIEPADKRINAVWLSGDGKLLACGGDDGVLRLYDPATGDLLHEARDHRLWISAISAPGSDTRTIVSAGWDLMLNVYGLT